MTTKINKPAPKQSPIALKAIEHYLGVSNELMAQEPADVQRIRKTAQAYLSEQGLPTRRHEDWQYTPLSGWMNALQSQKSPGVVLANQLKDHLPSFDCFKLVFVDGVFSETLSDTLSNAPKGCEITLQSAPLSFQPQDAFQALYAMLSTQTLSVQVQPKAWVETPILIAQVSTQPGVESLGMKVVVNEQAQCSFIQQHITLDNSVQFSNGYQQFELKEQAQVKQYVLQNLNGQSFYFKNQGVTQGKQSDFQSFYISLGALVSRHMNVVEMNAEYCETSQNSVVLVEGKQVCDSRTITQHNQPHGNSQQLHKFVLYQQARGVFNGMIYVAEDAQKTNGLMDNKNLLLSNEAKMDTKPQLEIYADDVKCAHGCASGQIDENQLFYCQARGIRKADALNLITQAFLLEPLDLIGSADIKKWLTLQVNNKLASLADVAR